MMLLMMTLMRVLCKGFPVFCCRRYQSYDIIEVAWCCNDQEGGVWGSSRIIKRRGKEWWCLLSIIIKLQNICFIGHSCSCYVIIELPCNRACPVPSLEQEAANGARKEATTIQQKRQQEEYDGGGCGYRNDCCASCLSVMMRGWWWFVLRLLYCCQRHAWMFARLLFTHRHTPSGRGTSTRGMCQSERVLWNPLLDYHHHSVKTIMSVVGGLQRNCGDVHFICASHSVITVIVSHPPQELWVASFIPSLYVHGNTGIRDHDEARLTWWCCIPLVSIYHIIMQIVGKSQTSLPVPYPAVRGRDIQAFVYNNAKFLRDLHRYLPTYRHFKHDFHNWKCTRGRIIMRIIVMEDSPVISSSQRSIECLPRKRAGAMYQRQGRGTFCCSGPFGYFLGWLRRVSQFKLYIFTTEIIEYVSLDVTIMIIYPLEVWVSMKSCPLIIPR